MSSAQEEAGAAAASASPSASPKAETKEPVEAVEADATVESESESKTKTKTKAEDKAEESTASSSKVSAPATEAAPAPTSSLELSDVPTQAGGSVEVRCGAGLTEGTMLTHQIEAGHDAQPRKRASLAPVDTSAPVSPSVRHAPDSPTVSLIASLRQQLDLVSEQATMLNTKLVASISKHADLEDQVYALQDDKKRNAEQITELERAKAQWEESMNTGLLVERDQIAAEMQRLATNLVEEERKRGTAEERSQQVENEVNDLTATLFDQVSGNSQ
jgi:DNA repair exonuclease SbcCD ATPase subunit